MAKTYLVIAAPVSPITRYGAGFRTFSNAWLGVARQRSDLNCGRALHNPDGAA